MKLSGGDTDWLAAWRQLEGLHYRKSSTYGTPVDPLANFAAVAYASGDPPERYVVLRMKEKLTRALNIIDAGQPINVAEYQDIASLALCAEALRRRR